MSKSAAERRFQKRITALGKQFAGNRYDFHRRWGI